jgi:hypothetical protein
MDRSGCPMTRLGWCGCIAVLVTVVAVGNMAGRLATASPFAGPLALGVIILTGLGWIVNELIELGKETRR